MTDREYDVVVVGGGGTGLAAAIAAREIGRSVALLEKNPNLGGTTALSVGSITATNTPHQVRAGVLDAPADHFADMPLFTPGMDDRDNPELRKLLTDNIPATFRWLLDIGLTFYGPMPEPPHRKPRMHNVLPNSRAYPYYLGRRARQLGVDIVLDAQAKDLIVEDRRVVGLAANVAGRDTTYRATGGVVLASGDFSSGGQLKSRYMAADIAKVDGINPTSNGDGQAMALDIGGRVINGDLTLGPEIRFVPPTQDTFVRRLPPWRWLARLMAWSMDNVPQALLRPFIMSFVTTWLAPSPALFEHGAILIDKTGVRFADERDQPALGLPDRPDKIGYIMLDGVIAKKFSAWPHFISTAPGVAYAYIADYKRNRKDVYHEASSLAGLAEQLDIPPTTLEKTIADHNAAQTDAAARLTKPPFIALGPAKSSIIIAEGGLAVNSDLQVLGENDMPIHGLYAAGSAGQGGLLLESHGHHLGWAFTSGRIAGCRAACNRTSKDL
jgi:fumarate reductase flavoprotein subunit